MKEPFDYQIRQVVIETRVGHVPNLLNSAAHRNTTLQPAINYPNLVRDIGAENHMEIVFASDLEGSGGRRDEDAGMNTIHCKSRWRPRLVHADAKNWDIWLDDPQPLKVGEREASSDLSSMIFAPFARCIGCVTRTSGNRRDRTLYGTLARNLAIQENERAKPWCDLPLGRSSPGLAGARFAAWLQGYFHYADEVLTTRRAASACASGRDSVARGRSLAEPGENCLGHVVGVAGDARETS